MFDIYKRLFYIFDRRDRKQFAFLALGILLSSFLEIVGIGLIFPFIALLSRPALLTTSKSLNHIYQLFHFHSTVEFMIILAWATIGIFIIKNIILFYLGLWQTRFVFNRQAYLTTRLFRAYLMSPYSFHLKVNLARINYTLGLVSYVLSGVVLQLLSLGTESVLVTGLFAVLFWKYPMVTLILLVLMGAMLFIYFKVTRKRLDQLAMAVQKNSIAMQRQINQGMGGIKESKLAGKEQFFSDQYAFHSEQMNIYSSQNDVISKSPRLFIETTVIVLVMLAMIFCLTAGMLPEKIFMMLSLFALVAVRLMPSLNRISSSGAAIRYNLPFLNELYNDLIACEQMGNSVVSDEMIVPILFEKGIELRGVTFFYEGTAKPAVDKVSLLIPKNKCVGFVGPSGAGKSTVIDIILGLLSPTEGKILVDGRDVHEHIRSWQRKVGYIPQAIYLADDSIKSNVAFGMKSEEISEENVWQALRLAQLDGFVRSLSDQLNTMIGERGVRLSGGQRQRIGIARALYNNPEILVMDEATSALDNETEREFMEALSGLAGEKTVIIIAHRLTTIQNCDKIFFLKEGYLLGEGNYGALRELCPEFRLMAREGHF